MRRKIFRAGSSLVISLPAEWVRAQGLGEGREVEVSIGEAGALDVRALRVTPIAPEFAQRVEDFIAEYRTVLEDLANR